MSANKDTWVKWGKRDPYWAVITTEGYHRDNLSADARRSFFETGKQHVEDIWPDLVDAAGGRFQPATAVDYGCGVGRMLLPLAERCETVVGVDISAPMIDEARQNIAAAGLTNVECVDVETFNARNAEPFDLVHSYIVLQHVPPQAGRVVMADLARRLSPGGAGMIHVTYRQRAAIFARLRFRIYRDVPGLYRLVARLRGKDTPFIPVYEYDLDQVREILTASGCTIVKETETDHGFLGKMFFISKPARV